MAYPPTAAPVSATPTSTPAPNRTRPRGAAAAGSGGADGADGAGGSQPGVMVGGGGPVVVVDVAANGSPGIEDGRST